MRLQVLTFVAFALLASVSFGQILVGPVSDYAITARYSPNTGDLFFRSLRGAMTTFELQSVSGRFTEKPNDALDGLFDVNSAHKIFKLEPAGFDELSLPGVLPPGRSFADLTTDLTLDGSFAKGGSLSTAPILWLPEPTGVSLIACGGLGVLGFRRRLTSD